MARTTYRNEYRQTYVYGNAVPKPQTSPEKRRERPPKRSRRLSVQAKRNRRKAQSMNKAYVMFLAVAAVVALFVCVNYIKLQSSITSRAENITALQEELADLKESNNTKYNSIMDSVNLEDVSKKAQEELGMVPASSDEIVTYDQPATNYVDQKEAIPESGVLAQSDNESN